MAPYLAEQFSDSLSDADRETPLARQRVGECETVLTLEERGFFKGHPELMPSFAAPLVRQVFEQVVVPQHSHGLRRCHAHAALIPIIEATRRGAYLDETFTVELPSLSIWQAPSMRASAEARTFRDAVRSLVVLAFCARYVPAIADVVDLETDLHTNRLDYGHLRWLQEITAAARLDLQKLKQQTRYVRSMTPTHDIWLADGPYIEQGTTGIPPSAPRSITLLCQE
jgi:hypothetical protein